MKRQASSKHVDDINPKSQSFEAFLFGNAYFIQFSLLILTIL